MLRGEPAGKVDASGSEPDEEAGPPELPTHERPPDRRIPAGAKPAKRVPKKSPDKIEVDLPGLDSEGVISPVAEIAAAPEGWCWRVATPGASLGYGTKGRPACRHEASRTDWADDRSQQVG